MTKRKPLLPVVILLAVAGVSFYALLGGSGPKEAGAPAAPFGGPAGAIPLALETVTKEPYRIWNEYSGRLQAVDSVEIRPQVSGAITDILFTEGAEVKAGDELFTIDVRPFETALARANAELASARSQTRLAKLELDRAKPLVKQEFLSKSVFDQRNNNYKVALATIKTAEAAVKAAKLNLEYAHIKAPISGRVSRAELTVGNLVEAGPNAPILTTIVASDNIYAEFDVDEHTYLQTVRYRNAEGADMPVQLKLASDKEAHYQGIIHSFDNQLDTRSGTIRARAIFTNDDSALIPGMFATVRLGNAKEESVIRISERAIGVDQSRRFIYVVGDDNKVAYREVELGALERGKRVVTSGLKAGERIVPSGLQRIRPGAEVKPIKANAEGDAPPANPS